MNKNIPKGDFYLIHVMVVSRFMANTERWISVINEWLQFELIWIFLFFSVGLPDVKMTVNLTLLRVIVPLKGRSILFYFFLSNGGDALNGCVNAKFIYFMSELNTIKD